ncbi:MAG: Uma2 family endonuclease [Planctomycetota bacterium]|nr:Uma2 family endonuclease [Planctomycetota bacterium]
MSFAVESELQYKNQLRPVLEETLPEVWPIVLPLDAQIKVSLCDFQRISSLNQETRLERSAEGDLIFIPPCASETGGWNQEISGQLYVWLKNHPIGKVFDSSTGFILPNGACRSPDSSWISIERWNSLSGTERAGFARICPDFVIELRSPSDSLTTLQSKMQEYMANGSKLGWLIDPSTKTVTIYRPGQVPESQVNPQDISGESVLEDFKLDLNNIFTSSSSS